MRVRSVVPLMLALLALALAAGCSKQEPPKQAAPPAAPATPPLGDGKTLFASKCSVCHGLDRATSRTETKEKWAEIVKTMQSKKVGWISDAEASRIVDFLAAEHGKK